MMCLRAVIKAELWSDDGHNSALIMKPHGATITPTPQDGSTSLVS